MLWSNVSNAADKSSKVRMETRASSALPRRQLACEEKATLNKDRGVPSTSQPFVDS